MKNHKNDDYHRMSNPFVVRVDTTLNISRKPEVTEGLAWKTTFRELSSFPVPVNSKNRSESEGRTVPAVSMMNFKKNRNNLTY